jgi:hypothetical protein
MCNRVDTKRVRRVRDKRHSLNELSFTNDMDVDLAHRAWCMM